MMNSRHMFGRFSQVVAPANLCRFVVFKLLVVTLVAGFCSSKSRVAGAADFSDARGAYYSGDYERCIAITRDEVEKGIWNDVWSRQLMSALMATGDYQAATEVYESVVSKFSSSLSLRLLAVEAYRFSGRDPIARGLLDEIPRLVDAAPWRYSDRANLLAIGEYLTIEGIDARQVLAQYLDPAMKSDVNNADAYIAIAELALAKADYQEAAKTLASAVDLRPEDPEIRYLLARAWLPSDSEKASANLAAALDLNPKHADSLLLQAEQLIDAERYDAASSVLDSVLEIHASQPSAWALKAAIAHLRGEYQREGELRTKALATWSLNPSVDHQIGVVLSKHYRFAEGAKYQERALRMAPSFLPAKFQLGQDLLRLGRDVEGWALVEEVTSQDKYNVVAFNLQTLRARIAKFTTIEIDGLLIRMDAKEARIYGERVVDLLQAAREKLTTEYEIELRLPVVVEIFPRQSDFAIRTFGLPGGAGFLGVCFGSLITANSPASQMDAPVNWESVLWHEFCHVVTLQKTNNRMPRWLSEGISVYEELEQNRSWGQSLNPLYKSMLLGEDLVPLSQLSGAFMNPKSALHLQFAYFESSMAVRYLIDEHGKERLCKLLDDLGMGVTMTDAFARLYGDAERLDQDFANYAREQAESFLPQTDFTTEGLPARPSPLDLEQWLADHPGNYPARLQQTRQLLAAGKLQEARDGVNALLELYPDDAESGGTLSMLAAIAQQQSDLELERDALQRIVELRSDGLVELRRLLELSKQSEDWSQLRAYAGQVLAIQPLIAAGHEALVLAESKLGKREFSLNSLQALQEMEPVDPAGLHFELARALFESDKIEEARREVLLALEFTPRYRAAQQLLVAIHERRQASEQSSDLRVQPPAVGNAPRPAVGL